MKLAYTLKLKTIRRYQDFLEKNALLILVIILISLSITSYIAFHDNGLGLAYNDARSRLDIARRVVEGLKPGLAQLGSVWLPLPHFLMIPTIWSEKMWHSGLSGALVSMISFVWTGVVIYKLLEKINVGLLGRVFGVLVFIANLNILYLQSTAMTELLLLSTMTTASYYFLIWYKEEKIFDLIKAAFWIMLATLTRYDAWFLLIAAGGLLSLETVMQKGYKEAEGKMILFGTLAGTGVVAWLLWNLLIFGDPLYFAFGPFSAHTQQESIAEAGELITKGNLLYSLKVYTYALIYNSGLYPVLISFIGAIAFFLDKKIKQAVRMSGLLLLTPFAFNIIALFLGHSVLFIQGLSGNTWFNVRYGVMLMPSIAIFMGYSIEKFKNIKYLILGLFMFTAFFMFQSTDAVTIDDATVGSSQKNVTEVSSWLNENTKNKKGFILISAASHDAIIFSSGLPMKKFIHEGTGLYWDSATKVPDRWARWIVMRTNDLNDLTFKEIYQTKGFERYRLVESYPFADIYEIKPEYTHLLNTEEVFKGQK